MIKILLICVALIGYIFYLFGFFDFSKAKKTNQGNGLKKNGERIVVPQEAIEIKSRKSFIDVEKADSMSQTAMLDSLHGSYESTTRNEIVISVLVYYKTIKGKEFRFVSKPIYEEEAQIRTRLQSMGSVIIYANPSNYNDYLFELD